MSIQRVGTRPRAMVQQAAIGFKLDGTAPSDDNPTFDGNGDLVFPTEAVADAGGLFVFGQSRSLSVDRVQVNVPAGDVAGWTLYITDGSSDVEVDSSGAPATNYFSSAMPLVLTRGESLKLVMAGASAGIIRVKVIAHEVDEGGEI